MKSIWGCLTTQGAFFMAAVLADKYGASLAYSHVLLAHFQLTLLELGGDHFCCFNSQWALNDYVESLRYTFWLHLLVDKRGQCDHIRSHILHFLWRRWYLVAGFTFNNREVLRRFWDICDALAVELVKSGVTQVGLLSLVFFLLAMLALFEAFNRLHAQNLVG